MRSDVPRKRSSLLNGRASHPVPKSSVRFHARRADRMFREVKFRISNLAPFLTVLILLVVGCDAGGTGSTQGTVSTIGSNGWLAGPTPNLGLLVATDEKAFSEELSAAAANDTYGTEGLLQNGRIFSTPYNTPRVGDRHGIRKNEGQNPRWRVRRESRMGTFRMGQGLTWSRTLSTSCRSSVVFAFLARSVFILTLCAVTGCGPDKAERT